jgi:hypothetical protein
MGCRRRWWRRARFSDVDHRQAETYDQDGIVGPKICRNVVSPGISRIIVVTELFQQEAGLAMISSNKVDRAGVRPA